MQRSLLFCCLQDTSTLEFAGVFRGASCPQIIQHYYIERIHLSVMDFLRFTTKQNWRKVVEEPNSEEKPRPFWWCFNVDAERKRLDFRRCLWSLPLYSVVLYNGSRCFWMLEGDAVSENDLIRPK